MKTFTDAWVKRDEFMCLTKRDREQLALIARGGYFYAEGRNWTSELRALRAKGLIFEDRGNFTITPKGAEVLERST